MSGLAFTVAVLAAGGCGKRPPDPAKGNAAFFSGDFRKAVQEYRKEFGGQPEDDTVAKRMAISTFIVGDYTQFPQLYNLCLRLSGLHEEFKPSAVAVDLLKGERYGGMDPKKVLSPFLLPPQVSGDLPHVIKARLLRRIAARVTRGLSTDEEKALALLDFVSRNVRPEPEEAADETMVDPIGVLMRGYGVRERSAWSFIALARQAGLHAHFLSLRDPADPALKSVHTLVLAQTGEKYVLLDVYGGFAIRDPKSGQLVTLEDVLANPGPVQTIVQGDADYPLDPKYFPKALVSIVLTPEAILPRMTVLQEVFRRELPDSTDLPKVAENAQEEILSLLSRVGPSKGEKPAQGQHQLPYSFPDREYQADIWAYPFRLMREMPAGFEYYRGLPKAQAENETFRNARLQQLLGNSLDAINGYKDASRTEALAEVAHYYTQVCYFENNKLERAIEGLSGYLETFPKGLWRDQACLHLGLAFVKKGDLAKAKEYLAMVKGPSRMAARQARNRLEKQEDQDSSGKSE
jgi:tetratricopeptide (TPR) repeat protein